MNDVGKTKCRTKRIAGEESHNGKAKANQRRFVEEYLANGRNGAAAYRKVFPRVKESAARQCAYEYLTKPYVREYLAQREAELQEALNMSQLSALETLKKLVFFDIRKLFNKDGSLKAPHELDDETAAALASMEVEELPKGRGYTKKIKVADRGQNLERMMRWLGMFKDKDAMSGELPPRIKVVFVKPKSGGVSKHAGDKAEAGTVTNGRR